MTVVYYCKSAVKGRSERGAEVKCCTWELVTCADRGSTYYTQLMYNEGADLV